MATHSGRESALELLLEQPARLENGLVVLDRRLPLDESVEVDALLRDSLGYPVVVLFSKGEIAQELGRMAAVVAGLQRGRYLLARLYADKGLDASLRPRFVLLGARFADDASALLDMMAGVEVHALEYRVVTGSNGQQVIDLASFHRTSGPSVVKGAWRGNELSSAAAPASPASALAANAIGGAATGPLGSPVNGPVSAPLPAAGARSGAPGSTAPGSTAPGSTAPGSTAPGSTAPASLDADASLAAGSHPSADAAAGDARATARGAPLASPASAAGALHALSGHRGERGLGDELVDHLDADAAQGLGRDRAHVAERGARSRHDTLGELQLLDPEPSMADLARGYFVRARDSIRSLSIHVSENADNGRLRYRVADAELATLSLDASGFHMQVGAADGSDGAPVAVVDEASFNERLNAVFTLYFNRLGPDRPTA